jgi:hypothetical protein
MKKTDIFFIIYILLLFVPFFLSKDLYQIYDVFNKNHGFTAAFIKFAVLATTGEAVGLRIREGVYNKTGFGLLPRALVWGFLGLTIKLAFIIFAKGTPAFLESLGMENTGKIMASDLSFAKVLIAFTISAAMNLIYAPVMMTLHKITDTHITRNSGSVWALTRKIEFANIFKSIDWDVQWNFVYKKTIPFFWIPAHTVTFLLPPEWQVLFAAFLGIVLGILLSLASLKKKVG